MQITKNDIDFALAPSPWDFGNGILYSLCQNHPRHNCNDVIIAKIWLIGRSYAAAVERRRNAEDGSDHFYETTVVEKIKNSRLDRWLDDLPNRLVDAWSEIGLAITVYKRLMDLFADMTGLDKRSLASKYLHFHRPDMFFLYDTRAKTALGKVTPSIREIPMINAEEADTEYLALTRRCQWVRDDIYHRFGVELTPRQVDKILLRIKDRRLL